MNKFDDVESTSLLTNQLKLANNRNKNILPNIEYSDIINVRTFTNFTII